MDSTNWNKTEARSVTRTAKSAGRKSTRVATRIGKSVSVNIRLGVLENLGVCIVLNKATEKLRIVQQLLPDPEVEIDEPYQAMVIRMTTLQKIKPPENEEPGNTLALKHVQKCRYMAQQAFERAMHELRSESEVALHCLKHVIFSESLRYYDNFLLKQENTQLNNTISNLKDKINEIKKNSLETRLYLDKMTQFCLEQAAVTALAQSKTLKRNTDVFLHARANQNSYRLKEKEDNVSDLREQYTLEIAKEDLINNEVTNFLQTVISNLQKKFEKWTARYSEEVDALDIALLQLRSKMDEQQEKYGLMSQQQAARQELLEVLQEEADERDREQEMRLALTKATVIIQQWWRQMLFVRSIRLSNEKKRGKKVSAKKIKKESPKKKKK